MRLEVVFAVFEYCSRQCIVNQFGMCRLNERQLMDKIIILVIAALNLLVQAVQTIRHWNA